MKKYFAFLIVLLFIAAACNKTEPSPSPFPSSTFIPGVGEVTVLPEDFDEIGDDPVIEYAPPEEGDEIIELAQNPEDLTLVNSFLGVSFTIPEQWFFWFMDDKNLRADPSLTSSESSLKIMTDEATGERYADFFDIGNNEDEYSDNHLGVAARAIKLPGSAEEYLENFKQNNLTSENVSLVYEDNTEINGEIFKRLVFFVKNQYDEYDSRMLDTFSIERNGYLIMVKFEAWASYPENEREMMVYMHYYVSLF